MHDFSSLNLVGRSPAFLAALGLLEKFAACDATVLVQGETGTGKDLVARAIHYLGARRSLPFIPVNCGALPDSLVENELFGHVRGAFTDARNGQSGLVATAEGGTLFLDEIECLSSRAQAVLLRFLQDRAYRPLGGRSLVVGDVRIIAASNVDLLELVKRGAFRQDLLYRLAILSVRMPPMRERPGDASLLAEHFIRRFAHQYQREAARLDAESVGRLESHAWPGNVREIENLILRELLMTDGALIHVRDPGLGGASMPPAPGSAAAKPIELGFRRAKALAVAEFERDFLQRALAESRGNVSAAARRIGKERRAFARLLNKHGIDKTSFA
jgi:DNA-binding NtrC family response regulator